MKKNHLKSLMYGALLALPCSAFSQSFCEPLGSVGSTSTIAQASVGFSNGGFSYSGSADVRNTSPSTGYTGSSANANVFFTNTVGKNFQISGINTSALGSLALNFGISKSTNAATGSNFLVEISSDGITYTALSFPVLPTGSGTSHWYLRTASGTIPSTSNLRIRFTNNDNTTQYRIDDICLSGAACSASIAVSGSTTICSGSNVILTASSGSAYIWSTGATTQTISVNQTGIYNVTVTASGCSAAATPVNIFVAPSPTISATASSSSVCPGNCATLTAQTLATDLFFSEYVEGSSLDKNIEIYNGTGSAVNLSDYIYKAYHNGSATPSFVDTLSGTLANGAVLVLKNSASPYSGGVVSSAIQHNGNDALALYKISTASNVDIFGVIGDNPGTQWTLGGNSTLDHTLRRKPSVFSGITTNPSTTGPSGFATLFTEWDQFANDDTTGLGSHSLGGSFSWASNTTPSTGNNVVACPTVATIYTVTGTYENGCSASATIALGVFDAVSGDINNFNTNITLCYGQQCSDLSAFALAGTPPFTFSWNTSAVGADVTVCPTVTTNYSVTITDANGCTDTEMAVVNVVNACCEGTNVIVCVGTETLCVDSDAVAALIDEGATVGPCAEGGRKIAKNNTAINDNKNVSAVNVYPNPFTENAVFEVKLKETSSVKIEVMDYTGKKINELNNSSLVAGTYKFNWNGNNAAGNSVANGIYFCRIIVNQDIQTVKVQKTSGN